jgi:radical SAM protein with 4Fe4S-binding SPASM domain
LDDAKRLGCKATIWSGGGEPFINKATFKMISYAAAIGLDVGIHTNGSVLRECDLDAIAAGASWIRLSLEAATAKTHLRIHGSRDFEKVLDNTRQLVRLRNAGSRGLTIGGQIVVSEENVSELPAAIRLFEDLGIDYLQLHPVTFNPELLNKWQLGNAGASVKYDASWYGEAYALVSQLETKFVTVKHDQWKRCIDPREEQKFARCYATFSPFIEGDGNVYYCPDRKRQPSFSMGNINVQSLGEIWSSAARRRLVGDGAMCGAENIDIQTCHRVCVKRPLNVLLSQLAGATPDGWDSCSSDWGAVYDDTPHRNFV